MGRSKLDKIIDVLIPPSLVLLLIVTIVELFYGVGRFGVLIDIFDYYVIVIFAIDLYYRWQELPHFIPFIKKYYLDIIATIPYNLIFVGIEQLTLLKALRGIRIIGRIARLARFARLGRLLRLLRFVARAPRFLRFRKHVKKVKLRKVQPHQKQMKAVLSFRVILLITINSIMGTGIWFLVAAGAKYAGPASLISWGILSLIAVYISMCFGELVSMFPKAGGVYEFAKQTYGRFWSFVIGWTTSIAGSVTIAMLLLGALQYLIPIQYSQVYTPIAIGLIILFSYVAFRGMQTSTYMLVGFALITLITVLAIIIPGFFNFQPGNFTPFFVFPTLSIILSIFFISETFFGWESAIFLAAETKNPTKVMPKALIYGTIIIAVLAFLLAATSVGVIPWEKFGESVAPLKDLGGVHFGFVGIIIFTVLVFISIIGAVASWIVTAPRLLMSMAEDKLFFVQFAKIHPKHKSPYVSIIFQVLVVSLLVFIGTGSYLTLLHMLIPLILLVYSAVLLGVVILRFKKPDLARPYKVWFGKVGPLITILFMAFLLIMFIQETHGALEILKISGSLIMFGIPAYFAIELFYDPKYVNLRRTLILWLRHHNHRLPLPRPTLRRMLKLVSPLALHKTVVDFDSPSGYFTKRLITHRHPFKKVFLFFRSPQERKYFHEKLPSFQKTRVQTTTARKLAIPSTLKNVDVFISFQSLGYVNDLPVFIKSLGKTLKSGGKFCFYVRHYFFDITPNAVKLADVKTLKKLFNSAGMSLNIKHRKHILREGLYFYGEKE